MSAHVVSGAVAHGSALESIVKLNDLDLLLHELGDAAALARLKKLGFLIGTLRRLEIQRGQLAAALERRWMTVYERARQRYGRAVAAVRGRVCMGCFITLPTTARPRLETELTVCESCGRILYWV